MRSEEIKSTPWKELLGDQNTTLEPYFDALALSFGWNEEDGTRIVVTVDDVPKELAVGWDELLYDTKYDGLMRPYVEELKSLIIDEMEYHESFL